MLEFTLFASILAGIGVAELQRGGASRRRPGITFAAGGVAIVAALAIAFANGTLSVPGTLQNPALWIPSGLFLAAAIVLVALARYPTSRVLGGCVIALTALDMSSFGWFDLSRRRPECYQRSCVGRSDLPFIGFQ
jgi:hypothetical protein